MSLDRRIGPEALLLRAAPLLREPPLTGFRRRRRRTALPPTLESGCNGFREASEGQLAVPPLAPFVLSERTDDRADPGEEAALLRIRQRRRRLYVEHGLDPGLGLLHVLAARAARTRETKLDLAEWELDGLPVADLDA